MTIKLHKIDYVYYFNSESDFDRQFNYIAYGK